MKLSRIILIALVGLCLVIDHVKPIARVSDLAAFQYAINQDQLAIAYVYSKHDRKREVFGSLDAQYGDVMNFVKLDLRDDPDKQVARAYAIDQAPVFILFRYGREQARFVPVKPKNLTYQDLESFILDHCGRWIERSRVSPRGGLFWGLFYGPGYRYRRGRHYRLGRRDYGRPHYRRYRRRFLRRR